METMEEIDSDFDLYQRGTRRTSTPAGDVLTVLALGIAGEAGEICDPIKKHFGQGHSLDKMAIARELGDVLWYIARMADVLGVPLSEVVRMNQEKLMARYPAGFEVERSTNRTGT